MTGGTNESEETGESVVAGDDRIAALEARIERLEAESQSDAASDGSTADDGRVDELADEVAALRETTDRLASTLDRALDDLDAIRESQYGALDEKREQQFETAVKSMVAFHQLATEVLDVRVENYEPAAGHADRERVEITRNRIGDALGVGQNAGGGGRTLEMGDGEWPDPEEAARGGRVFGGDDGDDEPERESDAPDSGVYPPIGGDDAGGEAPDEADADGTDDEPASDAPDTGVYPPIGEDRDEGENRNVDASLPESVRPDTEPTDGSITEGHVVDPIRSTREAVGAPLDTDPETALALREAVVGERSDASAADPWRLDAVDPASARDVRDAVVAVEGADEFPAGEAYARIVDEPSADAVKAPGGDPQPGSAPDDDDD